MIHPENEVARAEFEADYREEFNPPESFSFELAWRGREGRLWRMARSRATPTAETVKGAQ